MRSHTLIVVASVVVLLSVHSLAALAAGDPQGSRTSIELGVGIVGSPGFGDALDRRFPPDRYDVSGGGVLFAVEAGFGFEVGSKVTVTPRCRMLAKSVTISSSSGLPGSQYAAFILLPGVSVRYALSPGRSPFYVCGDIALVSGQADEELLTFEGRGVSIGAGVGVSLGGGKVDLELGHWSAPVRESAPEQRDDDFGGFGFIVRTRWFL